MAGVKAVRQRVLNVQLLLACTPSGAFPVLRVLLFLYGPRGAFFAALQEGTASGSPPPFQPLPQAASWAQYNQSGLRNFVSSFEDWPTPKLAFFKLS